jgi:hypothetical protein
VLTIGPERPEIHYIEVATAVRERGVGTGVMEAFAKPNLVDTGRTGNGGSGLDV